MKTVTFALASFALGLVASSEATAQPMDWVKLRQTTFTHRLPKDWKFLGRKFNYPTKKYLGGWRYSSPNGYEKLFIRVSEMKKDTLLQSFEKGISHLRRKAKDLKPSGKPHTEKVEGNPYILQFFEGTLMVRDRKTQKRKPVKHTIARLMQRYPGSKLQATATYLFGGDKAADLADFVQAHMRGIDVVKTERELRVARLMAKAKRRAALRIKADPKGAKLLEQPK